MTTFVDELSRHRHCNCIKAIEIFTRGTPGQTHHVVFRSRDDPFAARDGKVGKDTVLLVLVPAVRLQALALAVVPQLQGVVEGGCQDVLAVWRELDEGHGRVVIVDQGLEALTGSRVPNPAKSVVTARNDERTIAIEMNSANLKI